MEKAVCAVCIFDTRSFTDNLRYFSQFNDDSFVRLIQVLCQNGLSLASKIDRENDFYFNSTGDGFILIFFGGDSSVKCYLYSLIINKINREECAKFKEEKNKEIRFGIGLEYGTVEKIAMKSGARSIVTYIGDVVNIASRIEEETKNHFRADIIMGESINRDIVKKLYGIEYDEIVKKVKDNNDMKKVSKHLDTLNSVNHDMLLTFLSEHRLKGVEKQISLFRVSPTLAKGDSPYFYRFLNNCSTYLNIGLDKIL
jgi:class 3 adenylate cyclase